MAINTASTAIDPPTLYTIFATPECDSEGNCKEQPLFAHGECFDFARCMQVLAGKHKVGEQLPVVSEDLSPYASDGVHDVSVNIAGHPSYRLRPVKNMDVDWALQRLETKAEKKREERKFRGHGRKRNYGHNRRR